MRAILRSSFSIILLLALCSAQPAQCALVLVLSSGNAAEDTAIENSLESFGHSVDLGPQYINFNGTTNLAGYESVVLLTNYNWNTSPGNMPAAGQTQLLNYVGAGGGLVTSEWLVWKTAAQAAFTILQAAIPVVPTVAFRGATQVTYSQVTPDPTLNAGLPASFTFNATNISGTETQFNPKPGATIFYDSDYPLAGSGVIGWDSGLGRAISFSTLIGQQDLANANYARLLSNAVSWSAGVAIPEPSSALLMALAACLAIAVGIAHPCRVGKLCAGRAVARDEENSPNS
jgi:hypothetical protein